MFKYSLLIIAVFLSLVPAALVQAQTEPIARPRRTQNVPAESEEVNRREPSGAANSEARRLYKLGVKYGNAGRFREAVDTLEQAVKLNPEYAEAYLSLGHAYYDLEQWEQAVDNIERGLRLKPKHKDSQDRLTHARAMLRREMGNRETILPSSNGSGERASGSPASLTTVRVGPSSKPSAGETALTKVYRVGPGDVLDVRTDAAANQPALYTVTPAGLLEHPDLSTPLLTTGLTAEEISARIEDDFKRQKPARTASVSVEVSEYASHRVLVSGLVKEPGTKILKREAIPLYVVVADAQPLPEAGRVTVLRNESNQSYVIDLSAESEMNLPVRPGDVITLQANPAQFFYVGGAVKSPGEKTFRRGLTLTQAIIAAGGLTKNSKEARLARDNGKGFLSLSRYKLKDVNSGKVPDPVIQPGDRITIE
jgi:protein involved in polysaccharide export with SLBB domain